MSILCNFCSKTFITVSNLNNHKRTAKYCLDIQKSRIETAKKDVEYKCECCDKVFSTKYNLATHLLSCNKKKCCNHINEQDKIIQNLELRLVSSQTEIEKHNEFLKNEMIKQEEYSQNEISKQEKLHKKELIK